MNENTKQASGAVLDAKPVASNPIAAQGTTEAPKEAKHEFTGKYAAQLGEIYRDARNYFDISHEQAVRLCSSFASDFGEAVKGGILTSEAKVGKEKGEQRAILEDVSSLKNKNGVLTNSMRIVRVIGMVNKIQKEKALDYKTTTIGLNGALLEWLTGQKPVSTPGN